MSPRKLNKSNSKRKSKLLLPVVSIVLVVVGLIAALIISGGNFDFRRKAYEDNASIKDKFGLSGNCTTASDLGSTWMYGCGGGKNYHNFSEVNCNKSKGLSFFFTIGKTDTTASYLDTWQWIAKYIKPEEEADFQEYQNIVAGLTTPETYSSAVASYVLIPMYISELGYKCAYYAVANEPDLYPFVKPEDYAKL